MTALMAPRLTLARIRGGVDALTGVAIIAPPHPAGPLQRAWLDGYLIAIAARAHPSRCSRHLVQESVSPQRHKSAVSPLFPMKPREQMLQLIKHVQCLLEVGNIVGTILVTELSDIRTKFIKVSPCKAEFSRGMIHQL